MKTNEHVDVFENTGGLAVSSRHPAKPTLRPSFVVRVRPTSDAAFSWIQDTPDRVTWDPCCSGCFAVSPDAPLPWLAIEEDAFQLVRDCCTRVSPEKRRQFFMLSGPTRELGPDEYQAWDEFGVNAIAPHTRTSLLSFAAESNPFIVRELLQAGADPNYAGNTDINDHADGAPSPPLMACLETMVHPNCETVQALLEWGADPNKPAFSDNTPIRPLHFMLRKLVARNAQIDQDRALLDLLLTAGADPGKTSAPDRHSPTTWTALETVLFQLVNKGPASAKASSSFAMNAIQCLLEAGATVTSTAWEIAHEIPDDRRPLELCQRYAETGAHRMGRPSVTSESSSHTPGPGSRTF